MTSRRLPPLWLAGAAVASFWAAAYSAVTWTVLFVLGPIHQDMRFTYVAAQAGLRYGWSRIYDPATLHALSLGFPPTQQSIEGSNVFVNPPLLAWIFAPLTFFGEPVAYGLWTAVSLAALWWSWRIAAPYTGLARATLLMLAVGLWPVLLVLYLGQPDLLVMAAVATAWWCCSRGRPVETGVALALATFLKPQVVALLPLTLLASARYREAASWFGACAILAAATVLSLGESGLAAWWAALRGVQSDPAQTAETLVHLFGFSTLTFVLWSAQGAASVVIAFRRRRPEVVFAAGILGSAAIAFHFHYWDYTSLVLAAWLVLRTRPGRAHRAWLAAGVITMQLMTAQASHADLPLVAPQLAWDAVWLCILLAGAFTAGRRRRRGPAGSLDRAGVQDAGDDAGTSRAGADEEVVIAVARGADEARIDEVDQRT